MKLGRKNNQETMDQTAEKLNNEVLELELVKEVKDKLEQVHNEAFDMQNYINIAYYCGKQWIAWDPVQRRLFEPPKDPDKTRFVANRIQKIVRTELAKVVKNKPIMNVTPASNKEDDIDASKVGDKVCDYLEYELNLQESDEDLIMWGLTTDIAFIKPYWNPAKGDKVTDPDTQESMRMGDVDKDIVNAFEIKWDPSAKHWKDVRWICQERARDVEYVKAVYGKEVQPEDDIADANIFEAQLKNLNQSFSQNAYTPMKNAVKVKEYWEKPSAKYPKGRRITIASDTLLYYSEDIGFGDKDDTERVLPFFPFWNITVPGRVRGMSIIENLIPIQKEYNRSRSQIIDNKNLMANPKWLAPQGSFVDDPDDSFGQVLEYRPGVGGARPERDQPPMMGADVYKNLEQIVEEFYFISGQQEVSHGSAPPGVTSGVAISFLQEQDDTVIAPTISKFIRCKQAYMSYMLKMIRFKYDIPRTLKIVGQDKEVEVFEFEGSQLTSTDVRVQEGTMFQTSKAGKQNWIMTLVEKGVLNPQQDRDMILRMLELGVIDDLYDSSQIDIDQAKGEQLRWQRNDTSPIVRDFYNHIVHINEHNKFRKSAVYEKMQPDMQNVVDKHILQHQMFMQAGQVLSPQEIDQISKNPASVLQGGEQNGVMPQMPVGT